MLASTLYGGNSSDGASDLAIDEDQNVYLCGYTQSRNLPTTTNALKRTLRGTYDAFVAKFDPDLKTLLYATYLGGGSDDWANAMVCTRQKKLCVTGGTRSVNFQVTSNAFSSARSGVSDLFITVFDTTGMSLLYSTYFGGRGDDNGVAVASIRNDLVVVGGATASTNFPVSEHAYDAVLTAGTKFCLSVFDLEASRLLYSTYWGGGGEQNLALAADEQGSLCLLATRRIMGAALVTSLWLAHGTLAQTPRNLALEMSADVQVSPPAITLSWPQARGATGYYIYRKDKAASEWGIALAHLQATETQFVDTNVVVGQGYEYGLEEVGGSVAAGFIYSGIQLPVVEQRGKILLLVESSQATNLTAELTRLKYDLIGDGWQVMRHDISPSLPVPAVRAIIQADYQADPGNLRSVFIIGHIAVPYSGNMYPDGHLEHQGAWPADSIYADMHGRYTDAYVRVTSGTDPRQRNIPGDGKYDQSVLPGDADLDVGRVDMRNLPAFARITVTGYNTRFMFMALMGDPTLRMHVVGPPAMLRRTATNSGAQVRLDWDASDPTNNVLGYYVYRAANSEGPYARISPGIISETSFVDASPASESEAYMVRAVKLQTSASGTYYNLSQGIFSQLPPKLAFVASGSTVRVSWRDNGAGYTLETATAPAGPWTSVPGVTGYAVVLPVSAQSQFFRLKK